MREAAGIVSKIDDIIGGMRGGDGDGDTGSLRRNGRGDQPPGALSAHVCIFVVNVCNIIKKGCNTLRLLRNRYFLYRTL